MTGAGASQALALIDADSDRTVTWDQLRLRVTAAAEELQKRLGGRRLVFLQPEGVDGVVALLACLQARLPVALVDLSSPAASRIVETYRPALCLGPREVEGNGPDLITLPQLASVWDLEAQSYLLHPELALLLTTSGSTGDPKLVRLSEANLTSNARSIASYLEIGPDDRAIQSLPLHYAYGLSVLTSHLMAGAAMVLTRQSFLRPEFWAAVNQHGATHVAGVPYVYETLHRLRLDPAKYPTLRTWTQAGGALRPDMIRHFHGRIHAAGGRFFVMYGQTEATARMAWLPPSLLPDKAGAIGQAIPGGQFSLRAIDDDPNAKELIYSGPNVMLGYAQGPEDLALGNELGGVLATGDLAEQDADGLLWVRGRRSRFAKLYGHRVSLDDVEREAGRRTGLVCAAFEQDGRLVVVVEAAAAPEGLGSELARWLSVPPVTVRVEARPTLPRGPSGKLLYAALKEPAV